MLFLSLLLPSVPAAASVSAAAACPHHCHCWLPMALETAAIVIVATVVAKTAAAATTENLDLSLGDVQNITY
jgi:hypothetical protein